MRAAVKAFERNAQRNGKGRGALCLYCGGVILTGELWHRINEQHAHLACIESSYERLRRAFALETVDGAMEGETQ